MLFKYMYVDSSDSFITILTTCSLQLYMCIHVHVQSTFIYNTCTHVIYIRNNTCM